MTSGSGTARPYVKFIGHASSGVTQSCHLVRYGKYVILLDCGLYQEADIKTNYEVNRDLLKKIRPKEVDYIILSHCHIDHSGQIPALYAKGCQAHIIVPAGSTEFLRLLWEDSMKIFTADCQKLQNKHGMKAVPFYTQADIDHALNRCIEIDDVYETPFMTMTYLNANHILYAKQVYMDFTAGSIHHRLGYTGDIGGVTHQPFVEQREDMPYCNLLIGENTYNKPSRPNKAYDRAKDIDKISTVLSEKHRTLIPCFSLGRTQILLYVMYKMWQDGKIDNATKIIVDSPLSQRFCNIWPDVDEWGDIMRWGNLRFVSEWTESQALQSSNEPCVILSASGFLNGGRAVEWLKSILPNPNNHVLFAGYSGENNMASQIRRGDKFINVNGVDVANNANITDLVSFSSHANYDELMSYYTDHCRYDKIVLVHGDDRYKPAFCNALKDALVEDAKSSKVVCATADTKIFF